MRRFWEQFKLDWELGLRRLPFFTQRTAVALLGVLVATLALLGGLATIVRAPDRQGEGTPGELGGPTTTALPATPPGASRPVAGGPAAAQPGGAGPAAPAGGTPGGPVGAPVTTSPGGGGGAAPVTTRGGAPGSTTTTSTSGGGGGLPPVTVTVTLTLPLPHLPLPLVDARVTTGPSGGDPAGNG